MKSCCERNRYRVAIASIAMSAAVGLPAVATDVLWDNGDTDGSGGRSNAVEEVFGARRTLLDDFVVPENETWRFEAFEHRHIWFNGEPPGSGTGMEITLWSDEDGEPGSPLLEFLITNYTEEATGRVMCKRAEAVSFTEFEPVQIGPGRHWFEATVVGPGNNFWLKRDKIAGTQFWANYDDFGGLQPGSDIFGIQSDLNFKVHGTVVVCAADFDDSGDVDVADLLALLSAWGDCENHQGCSEDIDGDGDVDFEDLLMLLAAWGPCP